MSTWILVAESSRAKLFSRVSLSEPITELEAFSHPECRLPERDLVSDNDGFDGGSVGQSHHVMQKKISAKDAEADKFARTLAEHLDDGRVHGKFDHLILMAPPNFLGRLRNCFDKELTSMVSKEIDKNLVQQPVDVIHQYI